MDIDRIERSFVVTAMMSLVVFLVAIVWLLMNW